MVRNSRVPLSQSLLEKLFELFFEVMGKKSTKEEFRKTMMDLLSPAERIMLAKRVAIIYLLLKKIDYNNICDRLKVSQTTVAKYSLLMERSEGIVPTFNTIVKIEKVRLFLKEIFSDLFPPGVRGVNWEAAWKTKTDIEKEKTFGI